MSDTVSPAGTDTASDPVDSVGWLLVETLGARDGLEPTVVAVGNRKRNFAALGRQTPSRHVSSALRDAVRRVVITRQQVVSHVVPKGTPRTMTPRTMLCVPVFSATGDVFGVSAWIGSPDTGPPPREIVGTFEWNAVTGITQHGPGLETDILGIARSADRRTLPEIWKYFTEFDYHDDYTAFVQEVQTASAESGQQFGAEIALTGEDGVARRVHMTVRSSLYGTERKIVGLVHVIADIERPPSAFSREFARAAAAVALDSEQGVGHMILRTGLMLEWLRPPPEPFGRWATEVPEIHPTSAEQYEAARESVMRGSSAGADLVIYLRFAGDVDWLPAHVIVTAVGRPDPSRDSLVSQAIVQVRTSIGIMAW
ncbi:hypothetical protein GCM10007304_02120 [Rhodococcoides trifolii]|uniref:Rv3651-like N-terminal domain-containing protein n=1 Tax=Rhodococcoides trifolii TaxID=908250 RepID=A0A917CP01_9NOCA|nr:GAF domain-containing protein [Rhodococcus trifolii]GGF91745.1 hypothetical protein GCM10007304_02120 [Rhodococcus trifolii]